MTKSLITTVKLKIHTSDSVHINRNPAQVSRYKDWCYYLNLCLVQKSKAFAERSRVDTHEPKEFIHWYVDDDDDDNDKFTCNFKCGLWLAGEKDEEIAISQVVADDATATR